MKEWFERNKLTIILGIMVVIETVCIAYMSIRFAQLSALPRPKLWLV